MQPQVESLDSILARYLPAYQAQKDVYGKMLAQTGVDAEAKKAGLRAEQKQAFGQIEQGASNKGMLFSGFSPDQQARYNATKFMPALAGVDSAAMGSQNKLALALAGLDTNARQQATGEMQRQQQNLFSWQQGETSRQAQAAEAEKQRQFQAQQNALSRALQQQQISAQYAANAPQASPWDSLKSYFDTNFKTAMSKGGLSANNAAVSRQSQDAWVNQWFLNQGILDPKQRQYFWDQINAAYNRSSDPTKDWLYRR